MKRFLILIMIMSVSGFVFYCGGKKQREVKTPRWGTAKSGLRLRDKPTTTGSKVIGLIPYGERVDLLEEVGENIPIQGANGKWAKVQWAKKTGYAFGGFLSGNKPAALAPAKKPPKQKSGVIQDMQHGDIACYVFFEGDPNAYYADFGICDMNLTAEPVTAFFEKGKVIAPSCEGDPECADSVEVDLITRIETQIPD